MTKEALFEVLGDVDERQVQEARSQRRKKAVWIRWVAAAACLCLVVSGLLAWRWSRPGVGGGDAGVPNGDGSWPEGVDPVIASIANFPATEDIRDVANAEVDTGLPLDGLGELGTHLPHQLPGGFFLNKVSLYRTTMKDGTVYDMLRASYASEDHLVPAPDGSMEYGESLCVMVYGFRPRIEDRKIFTRETAADYLAGQTEPGLKVTFSSGDVYFNIVNHHLTPAELVEVIDSIP